MFSGGLPNGLTDQTRPKAPIPTGCRSVYLQVVSNCDMRLDLCSGIPAGDLKGGTEDLGTNELRHLDCRLEPTRAGGKGSKAMAESRVKYL